MSMATSTVCVSLCADFGKKRGQVVAGACIPLEWDALTALAKNKLRMSKKDMAKAEYFMRVKRTGPLTPLLTGGPLANALVHECTVVVRLCAGSTNTEKNSTPSHTDCSFTTDGTNNKTNKLSSGEAADLTHGIDCALWPPHWPWPNGNTDKRTQGTVQYHVVTDNADDDDDDDDDDGDGDGDSNDDGDDDDDGNDDDDGDGDGDGDGNDDDTCANREACAALRGVANTAPTHAISIPLCSQQMNGIFPSLDGNVLPYIREAIAGTHGFTVKDCGTYYAFDYSSSDTATLFPDPLSMPKRGTDRWRAAVRRECRGLLVCIHTGRVLARRFHKFFNVDELPECSIANVTRLVNDARRVHRRATSCSPSSSPVKPHETDCVVATDKIDGSLVSPMITPSDGALRWVSKAVISCGVEAFAKAAASADNGNMGYNRLAMECIANDKTPIFEWCQAGQTPGAITHRQSSLTLLAVRHMVTGQYDSQREVDELGRARGVPVAARIPVSNVKHWIDTVRGTDPSQHQGHDAAESDQWTSHGREGIVLSLSSGQRFKVKTFWYTTMVEAAKRGGGSIKGRYLIELLKLRGGALDGVDSRAVWETVLHPAHDDLVPMCASLIRDRQQEGTCVSESQIFVSFASLANRRLSQLHVDFNVWGRRVHDMVDGAESRDTVIEMAKSVGWRASTLQKYVNRKAKVDSSEHLRSELLALVRNGKVHAVTAILGGLDWSAIHNGKSKLPDLCMTAPGRRSGPTNLLDVGAGGGAGVGGRSSSGQKIEEERKGVTEVTTNEHFHPDANDGSGHSSPSLRQIRTRTPGGNDQNVAGGGKGMSQCDSYVVGQCFSTAVRFTHTPSSAHQRVWTMLSNANCEMSGEGADGAATQPRTAAVAAPSTPPTGLVIVMRGLPAVGKSGIVDKLRTSAATGDVEVCSADIFFEKGAGDRRLAKDKILSNLERYNECFDTALLPRAHAHCREMFDCAVKRGCPLVIVDNTNIRRRDYAHYIRLAHDCGYQTTVIEIAAPPASRLEELRRRGRHNVPINDLLRMHRNWEQDPSALHLTPHFDTDHL